MSVKIVGTTSGQEVEVDQISKAMRVTWYDINGIPNGPRWTYDTATLAFIPATIGPQDVFVIQGSATKTVRVTRIRLSGVQTTAGINSWYLLRRQSSSFTGGTQSIDIAVQRDSISPTPTATVFHYAGTVNPATSGSLVGAIRAGKLLSAAPAGVSNDNIIWDFDDYQTTPIYLRGISQSLCINFNGAALPAGLSIHCAATWTEE